MENGQMDKVKKLAVLIDADNASHKTIGLVLQEVAKYGMPVVKRVYGDWSSEISEDGKLVNRLFAWREVSLAHAITPIQQFAYTRGKDATDMMLIINAMDLLHDNHLDGFCIISSDSDFTPLASRVRESGLMVYGFGKKTAVKSFVNACDKFIYIENLTDNNLNNDGLNDVIEVKSDKIDNKPNDNVNTQKAQPKPSDVLTKSTNTTQEPTATSNQAVAVKVDEATLQLIYKAIEENADDDGFANLSTLGNYLIAVKPDFDTRNYGRATLSKLLQALGLFDIEQRDSQKYVRKRKGFAFSEFLKILDGLIRTHYGVGQWAKFIALEEKIAIYPNEYGFNSTNEMLKNINSKYFELNDNKTAIRLLK